MSFNQPAATVVAALIAVIGVAISLYVNAISLKSARKIETDSVIKAAKSDIRSIVIALERMKIVEQFISVHKDPDQSSKSHPWVYKPGDENYFQLFGAIAPQIGRLQPDLAKEIVRFYTFLRLSRDAAKRLYDLNEKCLEPGVSVDVDTKKEYMKNVLIALNEMLSAAIIIIDDSISTDEALNDAIKKPDDNHNKNKSLLKLLKSVRDQVN